MAGALFWVIVGVIAAIALYPQLTLPEPQATERMAQYCNHALAFSVLMLVGAVGWGLRRSLVAGVTLDAIGLEIPQIFSPGRQTTLPDILDSLAGVAFGCILAFLSLAFLREHLRPMTDVNLHVESR